MQGGSMPRPTRLIILLGLAVLLLVVMLTACSTRKMTVRAAGGVMADGVTAFEKDDDLDLIERALPANIKLLEALLESDPQNRQLLVLLARLYASYSFAFFDGRIEAAELTDMPPETDGTSIAEMKESAVRYYRKGNDYSLRALEIRHPEARGQLADPSKAESFIRGLDRDRNAGPVLVRFHPERRYQLQPRLDQRCGAGAHGRKDHAARDRGR